MKLTIENIKENWRKKYYTTSGYLYHLALASQQDGSPLVISSITQFCEEFELTRESYYRARRKLIKQGDLSEERKTGMSLRIKAES